MQRGRQEMVQMYVCMHKEDMTDTSPSSTPSATKHTKPPGE